MESSRMEATRVHRQSATTKSTETLGIHTCIRVPRKAFATLFHTVCLLQLDE